MTLVLCAQQPSWGQVNAYFDHNPVWKVHSTWGAQLPCIQYEDYNYYLNGDTAINGLVYKQVFKKGIGYYGWFGSPPPPPSCSTSYSFFDILPSYFVRSDNKKMFVIPFNDSAEQLLFDFDLAVGDSLPISYSNFDSAITVTAIDSLYTPYGYRKKFALSGNTAAQELLEGIGHTNGFVESINLLLDWSYNLLCYSLNDTAWYPTNGPTCMLNVGLPEAELSLSGINVYPNPFQLSTTITWNKNFNVMDLVIYNLQGMKVREEKSLTGNKVVIDRRNLESGVYFYELQQENSVACKGKLVIMN